jgi:hypothetical protein
MTRPLLKIQAVPETPDQLLEALATLFPGFRDEWESGEVAHSFHGVMLRFTPYFGKAASLARADDLAGLAALIDRAVAVEGPLENAVATCFLEHLGQVGAWRLLRPHLSDPARDKTRA